VQVLRQASTSSKSAFATGETPAQYRRSVGMIAAEPAEIQATTICLFSCESLTRLIARQPVQVARVPCQARLIRRRARPQLGALRHLFLTRSYRASERANPVDLPAP
jgi:hypothetical protein